MVSLSAVGLVETPRRGRGFGHAARVSVPGWPEAFRGSDAVAAGLVGWGRLRGSGFLRVLPDVYVPAAPEAPPLRVRSLAAYRWAQHLDGVVSGYSAAELHGASCARWSAPAEITVTGHSLRAPAGVLVRRDVLLPDEIQTIGDVQVTTPFRTAFDIMRRSGLVEAVVAVDALANRGRFEPDSLLYLAAYHRGARGIGHLADVLTLADRRAESPMETRLRLVLVLRGLPHPAVQHPVLDDERRQAVWLDLAYPDKGIGIEYEGAVHTEPDRVLADIDRYTRLVADGWRIYRYTKHQVIREPDRIVADISAALARPRVT